MDEKGKRLKGKTGKNTIINEYSPKRRKGRIRRHFMMDHYLRWRRSLRGTEAATGVDKKELALVLDLGSQMS